MNDDETRVLGDPAKERPRAPLASPDEGPHGARPGKAALTLGQLQDVVRETYLARDRERGLERTFLWFVEEVGELSRELKSPQRDEERLRHEMSDVLAWLMSVANLTDVDLQEAAQTYAEGCPRCGTRPCRCPTR